jgi:hypothetical protein
LITVEIHDLASETKAPEIMFVTIEAMRNGIAMAIPTKVRKMALIEILEWSELA